MNTELLIGLLVVAIAVAMCACISLRKPITDSINSKGNIEDTIFVSLSCRAGKEYECAETLYSLYKNAQSPYNVRVTIAMETSTEPILMTPINIYEMYCGQRGSPTYSANIRHTQHKERREAMLQGMGLEHYKNEKYWMCLQSGAAMDKNWDQTLITTLWEYAGRNIITALPGQSSEQGCLPVFSGGVLNIRQTNKVKVVGFLVPALIFGSSASYSAAMETRRGNGTLRAKNLAGYRWELMCPPEVPIVYPSKPLYRRL